MTDKKLDQHIEKAMEDAVLPENIEKRIAKVTAAVRLSARTDPDRGTTEEETLRKTEPVRRSPKGFRGWRTALLAAAIAACTGITVFAGVSLYRFRVEKQAEHRIGISMSAEDAESADSLSAAEPAAALTEVPSVTMKIGYLPEGLIDNSADKGQISYIQADGNGGYFIGEPIILDGEVGNFTQSHIKEWETVKVGDTDALYVSRQNGLDADWLWKDLYIPYPGLNRILILTAWGYAPKEELLKIAGGITLTAGEDTIPLEGQPTWSQFLEAMAARAEEEENYSYDESRMTASAEEMANLYELGDAVTTDVFQKDQNAFVPVTVKALRVQTADDLSLLADSSRIPEEWKALADENGKLGTAVRTWYTLGDGVNTLDTKISEEEIPLKLVEVTLEYSNETDQDLENVLYYGCLLRIAEEDGTYRILRPETQNTDYAEDGWYIGGDKMLYNCVDSTEQDEEQQVRNQIPVIRAGGSKTVHMAWILCADEADNLYLSVDEGGGNEFSESMLQTGLIRLP